MSLITEKDVHGYSAVHYAAMKGDIKVSMIILLLFWAFATHLF